jgi:Tfp pilus assembly protein PilN
MKNRFIRFASLLCVVVGAAFSVQAQRQRGQALRQLGQDVQSAMPHATLSDDQKSKLQSDIDGINAALQARQQGQSLNRDKMSVMIEDMHQIVDSGAFKEDDQKKLDKEFNSISSQ